MMIEEMRKLCSDDTIQISDHCLKRCRERGIALDEIESCIMHGEIIEEYPNDFPYSSALVLSFEHEKPIHVVAGLSEECLWIITAYYPDDEKWESDYKTRKESAQ
ncbi:MAG: DUF4258 domain-containing protein [Ruminococcus sp.]|nr:DUF4258 domain-containing protein [Ruminococcus sp.]